MPHSMEAYQLKKPNEYSYETKKKNISYSFSKNLYNARENAID